MGVGQGCIMGVGFVLEEGDRSFHSALRRRLGRAAWILPGGEEIPLRLNPPPYIWYDSAIFTLIYYPHRTRQITREDETITSSLYPL